MNITLYNFSKKKNSTGVPSGSGTTVTAVLKEPTDVLNPVFRLQSSTFTGNNFNYVSGILMGKTRYYRIVNSSYETNDIVLITCEEDYNATWRSDIKASDQFVMRSSDANLYSAGIRPLLIDTAIPTTGELAHKKVTLSNVYDTENGFYVLGIIGIVTTALKRGPVSYIVMTSAQMSYFINVMTNLQYEAADYRPIQYVVSCVYIPLTFDNSNFDATQGPIKMGSYILADITYYSFKASATNKDGVHRIYLDNVTLPKHEQIVTDHYGSYLNYAPYYRCHVFAQAFGDFDLPVERLRGSGDRTLSIEIAVDYCTGMGRLEIFQSTTPIMELNGKLGVEVLLAQITSNSLSGQYEISGHLVTSAGAALSLKIGESAKEMAAAVYSSWQNGIQHLDSTGSIGDMSVLYDDNIHFIISQEYMAEDDTIHIGRPVMANINLSTAASGAYVICRNACIDIPAYKSEIDNINEALESGLYLE